MDYKRKWNHVNPTSNHSHFNGILICIINNAADCQRDEFAYERHQKSARQSSGSSICKSLQFRWLLTFETLIPARMAWLMSGIQMINCLISRDAFMQNKWHATRERHMHVHAHPIPKTLIAISYTSITLHPRLSALKETGIGCNNITYHTIRRKL